MATHIPPVGDIAVLVIRAIPQALMGALVYIRHRRQGIKFVVMLAQMKPGEEHTRATVIISAFASRAILGIATHRAVNNYGDPYQANPTSRV